MARTHGGEGHMALSFPRTDSHCVLADVFMTQFSALQTARSVRTRRLAAAEENIEVARAARLAQIFKEICDGIISYKGDPAHPRGFLLSFSVKILPLTLT